MANKVLHLSLDNDGTVRQNGMYVGQGENFFKLLVDDPDTLTFERIVITIADKEWELRAPYRFSGELLTHLSTLPPRAPSFTYSVEGLKEEERQEEQRRAEEKERERQKRRERISRPSADPSLEVSKLWTPRFTRKERRLKGSGGIDEFLQAPQEKNRVQGLRESQVYAPGEVTQKASRFNARGVSIVRDGKPWGKWLAALCALMVVVVGVFVGGRAFTQTVYHEVCYDARTLFVLPAQRCVSGEKFAERGWVLEGTEVTEGEQAPAQWRGFPSGNIRVETLEDQIKQD